MTTRRQHTQDKPFGQHRDASNAALAALINDLKAGNRRALGELYDATAQTVYGVAATVMGSAQDAEQVLVDVYLFVWEHADRYDGSRGTVLGWLKSVARYSSLSRVKQRALPGGSLASVVAPRPQATLSPLHRKLLWLLFLDELARRGGAAERSMPN